MNLQEARNRIPELAGLSDESALNVIHEVYYPTMDKAQLAERLGYKAPPPAAPERSWGEVAQDVGITALKSAIAVPETVVGMADLVSGGRAGKLAEEAGFRPREAKAMLDEGYSDQQKAAFKAVQDAEGIGGTFMAAVENPSVIGHSVLESAAPMLASGVVARGLMGIGARGVSAAAGGVGPAIPGAMTRAIGNPRTAGMVAGALGEGITMAGGAAEQYRQQTEDGLITGEQAGLAAATGIAGTVFSVLGGRIAQKFGFGDVDTMLAGVATNPASAKGIVRSTLEAAFSEGVLEELPQSVVEQVLQNQALGRPLDEGVDQAAVLGTLAGGAMGAGANLVSRAGGATPEPMVKPPSGPMGRAAQKAPAPAQAAAPLPMPAPEHAQALLAHANERARLIDEKAKGTKDQKITGPDGKPMVVPGRRPEFLTPEEKAEREFLNANGGDAAALAQVYTDVAAPPPPPMGQSLTGTSMESLLGGGGMLGGTDPVAARINRGREDEAATAINIQQFAATQPPRTAGDAFNVIEEAKARGLDFTVAPHPDGGFLVVPRARVSPEVAAQAEAELGATIARMRQADAAPVQRAPRARSDGQELNLSTDPVANYLDELRAVNTPAARAYVREFDAGRITTEDVQQRMAIERGKTPDERLAEAAAEGLKMNPKGDPFKTLMAARIANKTTPGAVIEVPGGYAIRPQERTLDQAQNTAQPAKEAAAEPGAAPAPAPAVRGTGVPGVDEPGAVGALNSEWKQFPEQTGTLNIPRADMPQIKAAHRGAMVNFLNARGIEHEADEVDPATLKPTQAEFSPAKVQKAREFSDTDRSILVSSDGHVVDGHHQWLARGENGEAVKVIRLKAPIAELLPLVREFPSSTVDQASNVQDVPQAANDGNTQAAPQAAQAPTPAGSDAATAGAGAAARDAGAVEAAGVSKNSQKYKEQVDAWNAMVGQYKAATPEQQAAMKPQLDAASESLEKARQAVMAEGMKDFKKAAAKNETERQAKESAKLAEMPIASRMRPGEHEESKGLFWEKTGSNEWTARGEWFQKGKTRTNAEMAGVGGMVPMTAAKPIQKVDPAPADQPKRETAIARRNRLIAEREAAAVSQPKTEKQQPASAAAASASQADPAPNDRWGVAENGFTGRPVYRYTPEPRIHWATVQNPSNGVYVIEYRIGDKVVSSEELGDSLNKVKFHVAEKVAELDAKQASHQDPGEKAEPATKVVVNESLKTAARNEDAKPSEMRKWLLGEIDKALLQAPDRADYDEAVKRVGEKDAIAMFTGTGILGKNSGTGTVAFDVPGDGKFKVRNSVRGLLEFRKNVSASLGFKDSGQKTVGPAKNDGVEGGSGSKMAAITNMIDEGDFEAARDYAEAVGINLDDVKVPRGERKPQWDQFLKDGTVPPLPNTAPLPPIKTAAQLDEEKRLEREAEDKRPKDTGWDMAGTGYGGKRYIGRNITLDDGRKVVARVYENAGVYEDAEVRVDGERKFTVTDRNNAQGKADAFIKTLTSGQKADKLATPDKMTPRQFDAWIRERATVQTEQFKGDRNHGGGDDGVGYITLSGKTEAGGTNWAGTAQEGKDNRDRRLIFRTDDNKIVWYDAESQQAYEAPKDDARLEITRPEPTPKRVRNPQEITVTVDGSDYTVTFDEPLATISDRAFEDNLDEYGTYGSVKPEFRKLRAQAAAGLQSESQKKPTRVTPQISGNPEKFIKVAAESVRDLRRLDVDRVLNETPVQFRVEVARYIKDSRKDLEDEVNEVMAEIQPKATTGTRRDPAKVSMFSPYIDGDIVIINGQEWTVKQDTPGWYLTNTGNWRGQHPTIRNIKAMVDLIREVEQAAVAQSKKTEPVAESIKLTPEQRKVLDQTLLAGGMSVEDYMKATGLTDEDVGTFQPDGLRRQADQKARESSQYHQAINKMQAALTEQMKSAMDAASSTPQQRKSKQERMARVDRDRATLDMLTQKFEHPFNNSYVSRLSPILKSRFNKQFDGVKTGTLAKAEFADASYRAWAELLIDAANKKQASAAPAQQEAQQATGDRAKPEPVAPVASKVDDFGEKLPPARRAMAAKLSEELTDDAIASQPLSKVWPLEENEAIEDTFAAAVAHVMREAIPAKPRTAYKVKSWVGKVKTLRDFAAKVMRGDISKEKLMVELEKVYALRDMKAKIKLLEQIDRTQWKRIGDVSEALGAIRYVDGKAVPQPSVSVTVDGKNHWFQNSGDINDHIEGIKAMLTGDAPESKMQFEIRQENRGDRKVFINKKGDKEYRRLMEFDTVEAARKAIKDQYVDLVAAWEGVKGRDNITERDLRTDENRPRTGKDHRQGRDISAEEFQQTFGFRGGEFGKWVSQGSGAQERQFMLNSAYDALMDLSDILGVPPKAISLEGTLGIAFGSRGGGWASAHFEPSNLVINLTKPRGAGALAHEWFHALDNYFARKRGGEVAFNGDNLAYRNSNYITHRTTPMMVRKDGRATPLTRERLAEWRKQSPDSKYLAEDQWIEDPNHKEGVRAEVEERFDNLVKALDQSPMLKRSRALEGSKTGDGYWSRTLERAARSFENYVQTRMMEQGYHNDFLANVRAAPEVGKNMDRYPYLLPSEVAPIAQAFDSLFGTIQTKEDDAGNVAMFSRATGSPNGITKQSATQIVDAIKARWANAPEVVVQDMQDPLVPEKVRKVDAQQRSQGAAGEPEGFWYGGKAYIVAGALSTPGDVVRVLFHEVLGHYGLRGTFGDGLAPILRQIASLRRNEIVVKAFEYGLVPKNLNPRATMQEVWAAMSDAQRMQAAEEVLAVMAQTKPEMGYVKRAIAAVRAWLRKNVPGFQDMKLTDADIIAQFILPARRFVEQGPAAARAGQSGSGAMPALSFSMSKGQNQTETEAFKRWFGDWQALAAQKRLDAMKPVKVNVPAEWRGLPVAELRERVRDALDEMVRSRATIEHPELGAIRVGRAGERKTISEGRDPAKLLIAADLANVLPKSILAGQSAPEGSQNILSFAKLIARVDVDGDPLVAVFAVRQQTDGSWYYNTTALKKTKAPTGAGASTSGPVRGSTAEAEGGPLLTEARSFSRKSLAEVNPDSVSKVVDADGKPLVVYHGTKADFSAFDASKLGKNTGHPTAGLGFFFSADPVVSDMFTEQIDETQWPRRMGQAAGANTMPVYLAISRPFDMSMEKFRELDTLPFGPDFEAEQPVAAQRQRGFMAANKAKLIAAGFDGIHIKGDPKLADTLGASEWAADTWVAFRPEQIKSATGNNGDFDPQNPDIRFSRSADSPNDPRALVQDARQAVNDLFRHPGKLSFWHKSVGTQYDLAQRSPAFKKVYDRVQDFLGDVSYHATQAADQAPSILPKLDTWRDIFRSPLTPEDNKAIAAPIFEGTLAWRRDESGKPVRMSDVEAAAGDLTTEQKAQRLLRGEHVTERTLKMWRGLPVEQYETIIEGKFEREMLAAGIVWTDAELQEIFNLSPKQIELYHEFRNATDKSLSSLAISDMLRFGGKDTAELQAQAMDAEDANVAAVMLRDHLLDLAEQDDGRRELLIDTANKMIEKADKVQGLIDRGYAPLSRFGHYSLDVLDADGERVYFGLFESKAEANKMARAMRINFPGAEISQGTMSEEAYKLFAGVSPETLELFGGMLGLESEGSGASDKVFQEYLKLAKGNRSAMKRLIQRKGIAGFSEDAGRVLAGFIYSNARQVASGLHMGAMAEAASAIPNQQGELKDAALKLVDYIKNPVEEAAKFRGLLFAQYLGGSIASAMVNMLQPIQVTIPYLSQFGGARGAALEMKRALGDVLKKTTGDKDLDDALRVAEEQGIVAPQEVHQLMAQAQGQGSLKSGDGTTMGNAKAKASNAVSKVSLAWGKAFGAAEQFNRRLTFIASYRLAKQQGIKNPAAFAEKTIAETQFVYNKGNKPRWARGAVGGTIFTFKQYSISYLELLSRMATAGEPGSPERAAGRKAALMAVGVLLLMGGAGGLPFMEDMEDLIDGFMQRVLGYNFSTKQKRKELLAEVFGEEGARFVESGVSGLPGVPIDVSGRLGLGNLVPGTGLFVKKDNYSRDIVDAVGPAGDLVRRGFTAAGQLLGGDVVQAAKSISPLAVSNLIKAVDMANMGMYRDDRGRKVIDTEGYEALAKAIGFQPNTVARVQDGVYTSQRMISLNKMTESEIAGDWAQGIFEQDQGKVAAARAALQEWNRKNPESPIRINMAQILKRVRAMRTSKEDRIAATAPKEIRAAVRRELQGEAQ